MRSTWPCAGHWLASGERLSDSRLPFIFLACGRALFCEAPGHGRGTGLPVVRARGAHCKTAPHLAMCGALASQWPRRLRFHASPMASPLAPRLCCPRRGNGFANGRVRSRFAGRAPCAHHWQANAPHLVSASQKSARPGAWPVKGKCFAQGLSPAGGSEMAREREVLRTGPFPCRRHSSRAGQPLEAGNS